MARLLQETQQVVWAEPHGGSVGHGVEVDTIMVSLHQVLVQDQAHAVVLVEEQSESCGTSLPHLREQSRASEPPRWRCFRRGAAHVSHHLQLLQHGRLISKAQVAAAHAELLGEVVEVDLRRNQRGSWDDAFGWGGRGRLCSPGGHGEPTPTTGSSFSCPSGRGSW